MSQLILLDESNVSRRVVYLWSVLSNGTTPAANEAGGQPTVSVAGLGQWNSAGTLLAISAASGLYAVRLGTSDVSVIGPGVVRYSSASALEVSQQFQVVAFNPYGSLSTFDPSTTSVGLRAATHSGATVAGLVSDVSIRGGSYSSVTVAGVTRVNSNVTIADATYSAVTIGGVTRVNSNVTIADANYSGVTVRVAGPIALTSAVTLAGGTYSDVTIGGVTRVNSSVTIANAEYSGVTVRTSVLSGHTPQTGDAFARLGAPAGASVSADVAAVKVDTAAVKVKTDQMVYTVANRLDATINSAVTLAGGTYSDVTIGGVTRVNSNVTIADGNYSAVTVRASNITIATGGIVAASFAAGAIDAVALATDAGQELADRVLLRNIGTGSDGGRSVAESLYALRNRVAIDGSIGTVYQTNDTSSAWTFSTTTVSVNSGLLNSVDPG